MEARVRARESVGSAKAAKRRTVILGRCFQCGEAGHRMQDCTKVAAIDDDIPISGAPTYLVESVWLHGPRGRSFRHSRTQAWLHVAGTSGRGSSSAARPMCGPRAGLLGRTPKCCRRRLEWGFLRERHAHRVPRTEARSSPWSSVKLGFSQAEVSRACCVGHTVRS